jgi:hypothetical protein
VATVAEAEYPSKLPGNWQGNVRGENETMSFGADGTFVSLVRPGGFIGMTLGQGVTGKVRGTRAIRGKSITLNIRSTEHERILNSVATATIETFKPNELVVKSSTGDISTFLRLGLRRRAPTEDVGRIALSVANSSLLGRIARIPSGGLFSE